MTMSSGPLRHRIRRIRAGRRRRTRAERARRLRTVAPWAGVLAVTAGFHLYRGVPEDAVIFGAAALALLLDAAGLVPSPVTPRVLSPAVAVPVAAVAVIILAAAPRYGAIDVVTVAAIGVGALTAAWPAPSPGSRAQGAPVDDAERRALRRSGMLWAAVAVACCLWEVTEYFLGLPSAAADTAHPVISDLLGPVFDSVPGRAVAVLLWLVGGYALLRRGRRR